MITRILAISAILFASFLAADAQDHDLPFIYPQLGHSQFVTSVVFSPDGKTLASSSQDRTIKLWDLGSGRELRTLAGHGTWVMSIAFSPDGKLLASGSMDKTVKIWDVATGLERRSLPTDFVTSVAFSPDGKVLASSGGSDFAIQLWDIASGHQLRSPLKGHTLPVTSVVFSRGGMLASSSWDKTVRLWDVASGAEIRVLSGYTDYVNSVAFSPDGKLLASGTAGNEKSIAIWDVGTGRQLRTLSGSTGYVSCIVFSPDGKVIASSGSRDNAIMLWDVGSGRQLRAFNGGSWTNSIAYSPDGKLLAATGADTRIKLWNTATGQERILQGYSNQIGSIAFSPDGKVLASGESDDTIKLWDVVSARELRAPLRGHLDLVTSVVFSRDGKLLASGSKDSTIKLWEVNSGRNLLTLKGHSESVNSVAFSPDGRLLASGSSDHTVKLWEVATGHEVKSLKCRDNVYSVAFSPNGKLLASGIEDYDIVEDYTVDLWDVTDATAARQLPGPPKSTTAILSVAFSPDGTILAYGRYDDSTIRLWDIAAGRERESLKGHLNAVASIAFSPDGRVLASGSRDNTVKLWDVTTGRELHTLIGHFGWVNSVAFSSQGKAALASGSNDGTIRIWQLSSGKWRVAISSFTDQSFLAITPEGYYDASSAAAESYLNVRVGNRVFPIGSYRDKFYRPDLVKLSLAGNSLSGLGFAGIGSVKLAPVVQFVDLPESISQSKLTVKLRITDGGGGIGLAQLFLNGTAVVQDSASAPSPSLGAQPITRTYTIELPTGPSELRAKVANADFSMWSNPAIANIIANLPQAPRGTLHAIVVGIQTFKDPDANTLRYPVSDAKSISETLRKYAAPLFQNMDIKLLTTPAQTARDSLKQTLQEMQKDVGVNDVFVFYAASHGVIADGEYFLVTSNVESNSPEVLKTEALSQTDLASLLANIPAPKKLVIIDTCQAQPLGDSLEEAIQTRGMNVGTNATILSRDYGMTVLAASTTDEEALEEDPYGHGLFTYVVTDGLAGEADLFKQGTVTNDDLATYVRHTVPPLAENLYKHDQNPTADTNGAKFSVTEVK